MVRLLLLVVTAVVAWVSRSALWTVVEAAVERWVRGRLGGSYKVRVNVVDTLRPVAVDDADAPKVAVVGGGLAGVATASTLAERGFDVTLFEAAPQLGGRLSAWTETMPDGTELAMEHGFHAWFANYHNLDRYLRRLGIAQRFGDVSDYLILDKDRRPLSFQDVHPVPILNLFSLQRLGMFTWRRLVVDNPGVERLNDLLAYDPVQTFRDLDDESYAHYAAAANLPPRMRLIFNSFTRAFFAEAHEMSMAEMVKSFHGYFLSHDGGLLFRYPLQDHAKALWAPITAHLEGLGVQIELDRRVGKVSRTRNGRLRIGNQRFDDVVLATDQPGTAAILEASADLMADEAPALPARVAAVAPTKRYGVVRVWIDKDIRVAIPDFVFLERLQALDSVTTVHRYEDEHKAWVAEHGGAVLELHCYSLPDDLDADDLEATLVHDLLHYFPELDGMTVRHRAQHVQANAAALHTGLHAQRPGIASGARGLWLAGDWIKIPLPVMLMEGAFTSGLLVANAILEREGIRQEPVYSVPDQGILHGLV